jgi:general secretion pathway protein D
MNYTKLPKKALLLLATPVIFSLTVPAAKLVAQSQTETKIRLMAEGLRARDNGDLVTAKTNFEQLLVLAPNDVTVQRLLAGVNNSLSTGAQPSAPVSETYNTGEVSQVVYNPAAPIPAETSSGNSSLSQPEQLAQAEEARIKELIAAANASAKTANQQAKDGDFAAANSTLEGAIRSLPINTLTASTIESLTEAKDNLLLVESQAQLAKGDVAGARASLEAYSNATSAENKAARRQAARVTKAELNPPLQPIEKVSPNFLAEQKSIEAELSKGRSQYVAGDIDGALETFRYVETLSTENAEAKYFLKRIAEERAKLGTLNRERTRAAMIEEVAKAWQRPGVFVDRESVPDRTTPERSTLTAKLNSIVIPSVSFTGVDLGRVVNTLAAFSEEFDTSNDAVKGVNIVLGNTLAGASVPSVNITLRNMTLRRILDIITENVGYQVEVQADLVLVKPSGTDANLLTEEFAVSKAALTRMTGVSGGSGAAASASADPFAPAPAASAGGSSGGESDAIKRFLSAAGVPFDNVPGASLAYDGSRILVTHTNRNIERIRNIIGRYNDVRQVEIEAKFMDVEEGAVEELGLQWGLGTDRNGRNFNFGNMNTVGGDINFTTRTLAGASSSGISSTNVGQILRDGAPPISVDNSAPGIPGGVETGGALGSLATLTGARIGEFDVSASLRALSLKSGNDLLSAPKVTVLSGNRATITVAQELRYPQSYGETQSEVSSGNSGGSAISITAGTPQDFTTRNVGVELAVTPTVEEDEYSISLELTPRVTEFEGFVEYGGQSAALTSSGLSNTVVNLPSGFYQPIFSTREINTRVTVWDGATLVMGGLTREETQRVNDKIPVLGDLPFVGRAFKSKGEATSKRNLLIFVTANLVSPGGSLKKQELKGVAPSSTFQNPTYVTPSNSESRLRTNQQ